jgi:hypothetical protein
MTWAQAQTRIRCRAAAFLKISAVFSPARQASPQFCTFPLARPPLCWPQCPQYPSLWSEQLKEASPVSEDPKANDRWVTIDPWLNRGRNIATIFVGLVALGGVVVGLIQLCLPHVAWLVPLSLLLGINGLLLLEYCCFKKGLFRRICGSFLRWSAGQRLRFLRHGSGVQWQGRKKVALAA